MFSSKQSFSFPIYATTLTPPRFTCSGEPDGPSSMWGRMLHKVRGSPAHKGQQSQNYEPEARFLRSSNHGTLLWQAAKGISAEWNKTLICGLLTVKTRSQRQDLQKTRRHHNHDHDHDHHHHQETSSWFLACITIFNPFLATATFGVYSSPMAFLKVL